MQILVVEDDHRISDFLVKGLRENNFVVTLCRSGEEMLEIYTSQHWDLFIIDVMLPNINGLQLVQTIRFKKIFTPVLMLSALQTVQDKINALDFGADDYITKPFHFDELLSRIRALTRRNQMSQNTALTHEILIGDLTINLDTYEVIESGNKIELSPRELKLLLYLADNKNKAVTRIQILNAVWDIQFDNQTNVVDVYISYLRNKIEKNGHKYIHTVKGIGYIFKENECN